MRSISRVLLFVFGSVMGLLALTAGQGLWTAVNAPEVNATSVSAQVFVFVLFLILSIRMFQGALRQPPSETAGQPPQAKAGA